MRRLCTRVCLTIVAASFVTDSTHAFPNFWKVFEAEYMEKHENKEWVAEVRDSDEKFRHCFMCHQGKNRKNHNSFGTEFKKLVDGAKDNRALTAVRRDPEAAEAAREKLIGALKKVCEMPVDPRQPDGETYGDRIVAGKWPGGELEDLKKEPPKEE